MKNTVITFAMICGLLFTSLNAQAGLILSFDDNDLEVSLNETFTLNLFVNTEFPADAFVSWGLDLNFDSSILALNSFTLGSDFMPFPLSPLIDADGIGGSYFNPLALTPGIFGSNILLGTFEFTAINIGNTSAFTSATFGDFFESFTLALPFSPVQFNSASANIRVVNEVSEPSTLAIFSLIGLMIFRLRRKS